MALDPAVRRRHGASWRHGTGALFPRAGREQQRRKACRPSCEPANGSFQASVTELNAETLNIFY